MKVRELMKTDFQCIAPSEQTRSAARMMRDANIGFLPICDDSGRVLGTVTDRDIAVRLVADGLDPNIPVENVMSREVICAAPDDDLEQAEELMASRRKSRLMIVGDDGRLAGVISLSDIARRDRDGVGRTLQRLVSREARAS